MSYISEFSKQSMRLSTKVAPTFLITVCSSFDTKVCLTQLKSPCGAYAILQIYSDLYGTTHMHIIDKFKWIPQMLSALTRHTPCSQYSNKFFYSPLKWRKREFRSSTLVQTEFKSHTISKSHT